MASRSGFGLTIVVSLVNVVQETQKNDDSYTLGLEIGALASVLVGQMASRLGFD